MDQKLILNDGTILAPAHAFSDGQTLWIYLDGGISLGDAFGLLNDPDKTLTITSDQYGSIERYGNFTDLFCIRRETNGQINAGLKKGVVNT